MEDPANSRLPNHRLRSGGRWPSNPPEIHRRRPCRSTASRKPSTPAPLPPPNHKPSHARRLLPLCFSAGPQRLPFRSSSSVSRLPLARPPPPFLPGSHSFHPFPGLRSRSRARTTSRRPRMRRRREEFTPSAAPARLRYQRRPSSPADHTSHLCSRRPESTPSSRYRTIYMQLFKLIGSLRGQ